MTITTDKLERQIDALGCVYARVETCRAKLVADNTWPMDSVTEAASALLEAQHLINLALHQLGQAHTAIEGTR